MNRLSYNPIKPIKIKYTITWILWISLLIKCLYVFGLTDYKSYFQGGGPDGYWARAHQVFYANTIIDFHHWWIWPPFIHLLFAGYFHALNVLNLFEYRIELTVFANVLMSVAGTYFVYRITQTITQNRKPALWMASAYSLYYPLIYLNAFPLSEGPGNFFFLYSLFLLIVREDKTASLGCGLSGFYLAFATASRSVHALIYVLALGYLLLNPVRLSHQDDNKNLTLQDVHCNFRKYLISRKNWKQKLKAIITFSLGFLLGIGTILGAYYYFSDGAMRTIGHNGAVNFFLKQCQVHRLIYEKPGYYYTLVPPSTVDKPELGVFSAERPFDDQNYYFDLGRKCISANSNIWFENLRSLRNLFFGQLYPIFWTAKGIKFLLPLSSWLSFLMFLCAGLSIFLAYRTAQFIPCTFLLSIFLCESFAYLFFAAELRYLYSIASILFILFGYSIQQFLTGGKRARSTCFKYCLVLSLISLLSWHTDLFSDRRKPLKFTLDEVNQVVEPGSIWNKPGYFKLFKPGIYISFEEVLHPQQIEVSLDSNDTYQIEYWYQQKVLIYQLLTPPPGPTHGMFIHTLDIPANIQEKGLSQVKILPVAGDDRYSMGHLNLKF